MNSLTGCAEHPGSQRFREGLRAGVPFAIAGGMLAVSFGVVAQQAGFTALEAILMSLVVFAGSAQFTAVAILAAGAGPEPRSPPPRS